MSGEVEAAGAAATAGLTAAAIDGANREASGTPEDHGACLNCGAPLSGNFCSQCGQPAHLHRTLGHMVEEFLHGIVHFDTRAWRTLPYLLFRPGKLTHDYIHGKRTRYISPLAIYLLAVFSMFFVFSISGGSRVGLSEAPVAQTEGAPLESATEAPAGQAEGANVSPAELIRELNRTAEESGFSISTGNKKLDEKIKHKLENPELLIYKVQNTAYKLAFLLVPISLPFVWLLFFWKRGTTLFDHTVFILYSLTFASLLFLILGMLAFYPPLSRALNGALLLTTPVHMFFHLKGAYSLGWFSALWRTVLLMVFSFLCLVVFVLLIIALGLTG
ncbi:MAG: DUF3667 domain-containing protein [Hyphomonadaceae bacterium]